MQTLYYFAQVTMQAGKTLGNPRLLSFGSTDASSIKITTGDSDTSAHTALPYRASKS